MAEPSLALHKALLAALNPISASVFDGVPQGASFPYVTLDRTVLDRLPYLTARKQERFTFLTIWSEVKGQQQVLQIMGEIDALLDGASLTLDTGRVVLIQVDSASTDRDADTVTFRGSVVLRVITEH